MIKQETKLIHFIPENWLPENSGKTKTYKKTVWI